MRRLALGSAGTVSLLICLPDAVGIIPSVDSFTTWLARMIGLWATAYLLWFVSFLALLHAARFAGGGIRLDRQGLRLSRFSKIIPWDSIKAVSADQQPLFSLVFFLRPVARKMVIYQDATGTGFHLPLPGASLPMIPHAVPSFQFLGEEYVSLFAYICKRGPGIVPNSLDVSVFTSEAVSSLQHASKRAAMIRVIMTILISIGLVSFLGRRAAINYSFNNGSHLFKQQKYIQAAAEYRRAARIDPTFAPAWDRLARCEFRSGDVTQAEKDWQQALRMKPDFLESKLGLSVIYMRKGDLAEAKRLIEQCARLHPHNNAVYLNQAELYTRLGDGQKARKLLEAVIREGSGDAQALAQSAMLYYDLKDKQQARLLLARALNLDPANPNALALANIMGKSKQASVPAPGQSAEVKPGVSTSTFDSAERKNAQAAKTRLDQ